MGSGEAAYGILGPCAGTYGVEKHSAATYIFRRSLRHIIDVIGVQTVGQPLASVTIDLCTRRLQPPGAQLGFGNKMHSGACNPHFHPVTRSETRGGCISGNIESVSRNGHGKYSHSDCHDCQIIAEYSVVKLFHADNNITNITLFLINYCDSTPHATTKSSTDLSAPG